MSPSLAGAELLLTRAAEDAEALARLVRERGGTPLLLPCLSFAEPGDPAPLQRALARIARGDRPRALALASPQAARRAVAALRAEGLVPAQALQGVLLATSGAGTARELERLGLPGALVPAEGAGAEALAAQLGPLVAGARVLILRAEEGNPELPALLAAAGAEVEAAALYRTVPAGPQDLTSLDAAGAQALAALRRGSVGAALFGSGSAARGFVGLLGAEARGLLARPLVACMGSRCAGEVRALGLRADLVADGGFPELLDSVAARLGPELR